MKVSVVGASGYIGGEAVRLLMTHPKVQLNQITSERFAGKFVHAVHPNLRGSSLKFSSINDLEETDVLFLALPHGVSMEKIKDLEKKAGKIIDLSGDFRLRDPEDYKKWYKHPHPNPEYLKRFVYGNAELHRKEIRESNLVAGTGCLATATIMGLYPLFKNNLVKDQVIVEAKVGSSASGNKPNLSTHHSERSNVIRSFKPTGHRHTAEIIQELSFNSKPQVHFSGTAVELVRGILATSHVFLKKGFTKKDIWRIYRQEYNDEPFVRIVKKSRGVYRYPEPKILAGTNFVEVGFELDPNSNRLVVMSAIDNLMKGGAGQAVQSMNIMCGFEETTGLEFLGLHPV